MRTTLEGAAVIMAMSEHEVHVDHEMEFTVEVDGSSGIVSLRLSGGSVKAAIGPGDTFVLVLLPVKPSRDEPKPEPKPGKKKGGYISQTLPPRRERGGAYADLAPASREGGGGRIDGEDDRVAGEDLANVSKAHSDGIQASERGDF